MIKSPLSFLSSLLGPYEIIRLNYLKVPNESLCFCSAFSLLIKFFSASAFILPHSDKFLLICQYQLKSNISKIFLKSRFFYYYYYTDILATLVRSYCCLLQVVVIKSSPITLPVSILEQFHFREISKVQFLLSDMN